MSKTPAVILSAFFLLAVYNNSSNAREIVFAEADGIQLVSVEQDSPGGGLSATMIQARSVDPDYSIVTLTNLSIGNVQNVWADTLEPSPTAQPPVEGQLYHETWIPYDSHLVISGDMIAGTAGEGYAGLTETNDGMVNDDSTLAVITDEGLGEIRPIVGSGDIFLSSPTDAFFLTREARGNSVDIAYVVGTSEAMINLPVTLSVGLLGSQGPPDTEFFARFGYDEPINVPFVPEPSANLLMLVAGLCVAFKSRRSR